MYPKLSYQGPVGDSPAPYIYDDTATRIIRVRNDPQATSKLDATTAIDLAVAHLGHEADDWELESADQPNDHTIIVQFSHI